MFHKFCFLHNPITVCLYETIFLTFGTFWLPFLGKLQLLVGPRKFCIFFVCVWKEGGYGHNLPQDNVFLENIYNSIQAKPHVQNKTFKSICIICFYKVFCIWYWKQEKNHVHFVIKEIRINWLRRKEKGICK